MGRVFDLLLECIDIKKLGQVLNCRPRLDLIGESHGRFGKTILQDGKKKFRFKKRFLVQIYYHNCVYVLNRV